MTVKVHFYKMVASGNDFIVVDHRKPYLKSLTALASRLCSRNYGVGADGLLLVEKSRKADIGMRIINADGSEAEMCGNGARCAALFAHQKLGFGKKIIMETKAGLIACEVKTRTVEVRLTEPTRFRSLSHLELKDRQIPYYFINTGVPHVIIFEEALEEIDAVTLGRIIRNHECFKPQGTNVNFVAVRGPQSLELRTYERGVESETLACGTGATASAIVATLADLVHPPVKVKTRSGEILKINFKRGGFSVTNVTLEGNAQFIFEGSTIAHV